MIRGIEGSFFQCVKSERPVGIDVDRQVEMRCRVLGNGPKPGLGLVVPCDDRRTAHRPPQNLGDMTPQHRDRDAIHARVRRPDVARLDGPQTSDGTTATPNYEFVPLSRDANHNLRQIVTQTPNAR